jgi:hypothetical protein
MIILFWETSVWYSAACLFVLLQKLLFGVALCVVMFYFMHGAASFKFKRGFMACV